MTCGHGYSLSFPGEVQCRWLFRGLGSKGNDLFGDSDEDDEEDEDEDEEEEDEEENDYESMTLKELKAEAKDRGLKVKKGMSKDDIIEMLEEDDEE